MTVRALLIGLLVGLGIASVGWVNDWILKQAYVASDLVPNSVYGLLLVGLLLVNPLLRLMGRFNFRGPEWAVIISLMLAACVIPGPGMLWTFNNTLVMPYELNQQNISWQNNHVLDYVPPAMLTEVPDNAYNDVVTNFKTGLQAKRSFTSFIAWDKVPWGSWVRPYSFWLPLFGLSFIGGIALVLLVHRQWAHRERLRYPVADFASELLEGAGENYIANIFRNPRFWMGFVPAAIILLVNGAYAWKWSTVQIPLDIDLRPAIAAKWPWVYSNCGFRDFLMDPKLIFVAVGFAYLLASEISFSLGISLLAYAVVYLVLLDFNVDLAGDYETGTGLFSWQYFGSYLGMGIMVFYIGRRFYWNVLLNALAVPTRERAERVVVWACRIALLSAAGIVLMLVLLVHLHWVPATLFVLLMGLLFLMVTRINVETGMFMIQPSWQPVGVMVGLFGIAALGPTTLITLALLAAVMTIDPKVCLMPLVANSLRFSEKQGVKPTRLSPVLVLSVLGAMVLGVVVTLFLQYNYGATGDNWLSHPANKVFTYFNSQLPKFETPEARAAGFDLGQWVPTGTFLWGLGGGLALVVGASIMRLRYQWWPLHPVLFLLWGTAGSQYFAASFFLGWLIKSAITKFGGGDSYRKNKPIFIGLIAGEFAAGLIFALIGLIYFLKTGTQPPVLFRTRN